MALDDVMEEVAGAGLAGDDIGDETIAFNSGSGGARCRGRHFLTSTNDQPGAHVLFRTPSYDNVTLEYDSGTLVVIKVDRQEVGEMK
ncbi:MAG: hypothetical protein JWO13_2531 [Acidobacteriales bacterium]|nr:hypothetical protein [Terriglobales bacterium]